MHDLKYNVLLLRDDKPVRRFRVNTFWLKLLLWIFLLLLVAAVAGVYFSISFWARFDSLELRSAQLEKLLLEKDVKLERLSSMSEIFRRYEEINAAGGLLENTKKEPKKETAQRENAPAREAESRPALDLSKLFSSVDLKRVSLKNISLKPLDNKLFKLSLDIASEDGKPLQVSMGLSAITKDAKEFTVEAKAEELAFPIGKSKPVLANIGLPEAIDLGQVFGVKLMIVAEDGKTLFSEIYPLTNILPRKADD
jgi:hypothetical protein